MAYTTASPDDELTAELWNEVVNALNGTSQASPLAMTAFASASIYAATFRNQGTGGKGLRVQNSAGQTILTVNDDAATFGVPVSFSDFTIADDLSVPGDLDVTGDTWLHGHLSVGETETTHPETLAQIAGTLTHNGGDLYGIDLESTFNPSVPATETHALFVGPQVRGTNGATTNTLTFYTGVGVALVVEATYDAAIADVYGVYVQDMTHAGAGTITNQFGFWTDIDHPGIATNNYAFYASGTAPSFFGASVTLGAGQILVPVDASSGQNDPEYSFTDDTNTGMYSPSADLLDLVAGGHTTLEVATSYAQVFGDLYVETTPYLKKISTPSTVANYAGVYPKTDNLLYFYPHGGSELTVATTSTAMVRLATSTMSTATSTVTFADISQNYSALKLEVLARGTASAAFTSLLLQVAPQSTGTLDTGTSYNYQGMYGNGTNVTAETSGSSAVTSVTLAYITAGGGPSNEAGHCVVEIPSYATTTFEKNLTATGGYRDGTGGGNSYVTTYLGRWNNTEAIRSVRFSCGTGNFATGSVFNLWGIP